MHALDAAAPRHARPSPSALHAGQRIADMLARVRCEVPLLHRVLHAGDTVYRAGERFVALHVVSAGLFKTVKVTADGREQVVGVHFKGDWLGFDGIAEGRHGCEAIAMDTSEVWVIRYDDLLAACSRTPALMADVHAAMSRVLVRDRDSMLAMCTLPADARVADFLRHWADTLEQRGLRTDSISLRMSRAEIGNFLGMTLETVSRSLSRLARDKVIGFAEKGRREVEIPDVAALSAYIDRSLAAATLH